MATRSAWGKSAFQWSVWPPTDVPRHQRELGGDEGEPAGPGGEGGRLREERPADAVRGAGPEPPGPGLDAEGRGDGDAADAGTNTAHSRTSPGGAARGQRASAI